MKTVSIVVVCALSVVAGACSSDSDNGTVDPNEGLDPVEEVVTATGGGILKTANGSAALDVPAGALAEDTTLTLKVVAKESGTATSVYEFGPDGTQFLTPVTLSIKYDGDPGTGNKAVLATYSDGEWVEIAGSAAANGMVSGQISHFSKFAVVIVDGEATLVSGCADVATSFAACGGDVQGTWKFEDVCFDEFPIGSTPWEQSCPEATMEYDSTWDATVTVDATTMKVAWTSQSTTYAFIAPNSCLADAECADVSNSEMTCATEGETCKCTGESTSTGLPDMTVSYTIEGNSLVIDDDGVKTTTPYCRQGDKLVIQAKMPTGDKEIQYDQVLVKQ